MRFPRVITALVTPFNPDGTINWGSFEKNLEFQVKNNCGVLPMGTTGESPTIGHQEHLLVIQNVVQIINDRTFILAGTGSNSTQEALKLSLAATNDKVDAVLLVDPYYNKPTSGQLLENYYTLIANAIAAINPDTLVVPYIIPGRTCAQL